MGHFEVRNKKIHLAFVSSPALLVGLILLISTFAEAATYTFLQRKLLFENKKVSHLRDFFISGEFLP